MVSSAISPKPGKLTHTWSWETQVRWSVWAPEGIDCSLCLLHLQQLPAPMFDGFLMDSLMLALWGIEHRKSQVNPRVKWELQSKILIWGGEAFPVGSWVRHRTILSSQVLRKQKGRNDCAIERLFICCPPGQVASMAYAHTKNATPLPPTFSTAQSCLSPHGRTSSRERDLLRFRASLT